jgi:hypothetical protein
LLDSSDLRPEFFKDIWRLHSNYAHSEFLSILQIRDFKDPNRLITNAWLTSEITSMILASAIFHLGNLFRSSKNVINAIDLDSKNLYTYFFKIGNKSNNQIP